MTPKCGHTVITITPLVVICMTQQGCSKHGKTPTSWQLPEEKELAAVHLPV